MVTTGPMFECRRYRWWSGWSVKFTVHPLRLVESGYTCYRVS